MSREGGGHLLEARQPNGLDRFGVLVPQVAGSDWIVAKVAGLHGSEERDLIGAGLVEGGPAGGGLAERGLNGGSHAGESLGPVTVGAVADVPAAAVADLHQLVPVPAAAALLLT